MIKGRKQMYFGKSTRLEAARIFVWHVYSCLVYTNKNVFLYFSTFLENNLSSLNKGRVWEEA